MLAGVGAACAAQIVGALPTLTAARCPPSLGDAYQPRAFDRARVCSIRLWIRGGVGGGGVDYTSDVLAGARTARAAPIVGA